MSTVNPTMQLIEEITSHEHASEMGRNVETLFNECLFKDDEMINGMPKGDLIPTVAEGIQVTVGFHPGRLAAARPQIIQFIARLDNGFLKGKGGGWSFLNLCFDKDGQQWANLHRTMEQLLQLAIASGLGGYCLPRDIWKVLPGGMPYVWFELPETKQ